MMWRENDEDETVMRVIPTEEEYEGLPWESAIEGQEDDGDPGDEQAPQPTYLPFGLAREGYGD